MSNGGTSPKDPDEIFKARALTKEKIRNAAAEAEIEDANSEFLRAIKAYENSKSGNNGGTNGRPRPQVLLPGLGKSDRQFAIEAGNILKELGVVFLRNDEVVEVVEEQFDGELDDLKLAKGGLKFRAISPARMKTWIEDYIDTGQNVEATKGRAGFMTKTMSEAQARSLLVSPQFQKRAHRVDRILDVAMPIRTKGGDIILPKPGFNKGLGIYVHPNAPVLRKMSLDEAVAILEKAHAGFCWKKNKENEENPQSKVHAYARILTPFARGLMGFRERMPLWFFEGNRPRCGKDYLNGITQILSLGDVFEDAAITENSEETNKRIVSALRAGRRMMHFANCQHHLEDVSLIQAITCPNFNTRSLGSNDAEADLGLANEIDFSLSANVGLTYREDIEPRLRKIQLAFFEEDANKRAFPVPFLHDWVKENRIEILSAIYSIIAHWMKQGAPKGRTLFNSFPRWAEVIGGIMECASLGDPCLAHEGEDLLGGDLREKAMRALFGTCYADPAIREQWVKKSDIYDVITAQSENIPALEWFGNLNAASGSGEKRFATNRTGKALAAFKKRILGGVQLLIDSSNQKSEQWGYKFTKA
jgi:hypothetical protein